MAKKPTKKAAKSRKASKEPLRVYRTIDDMVAALRLERKLIEEALEENRKVQRATQEMLERERALRKAAEKKKKERKPH
jgi:CRP-like cAMP-binding protein